MSKSIEQLVAEEMNKVMMYGMDEQGKLTEPDEQIDLEMTDKNLAKEIAKRAKEDLRPDDKESFSKKAWDYFKDNDLLPEEDAEAEAEDEPAEQEEQEEAPKAKKETKKETKPAKKEKKASKRDEDVEDEKPAKKVSKRSDEKPARAPREKGPSFEDIACQIVKKTPPEDCRKALMDKFTELYKERGKTDEEFITKRVEIYYRIAAGRLGVEMALPPKKAKASKRDKEEKTSKCSRRDDD